MSNGDKVTVTPSSGGKRLVKSKSGLKIVCQHDRESAPWDMAEPHWVPDKEVDKCVTCDVKFDFIKRRHHCRRCGSVFCGKCCGTKIQFHRMGFVDPVRLCKACADVTKKEEEFFNNDLKVLLAGAPFKISVSRSQISSPLQASHKPTEFPEIWEPGTLYNCKLSSDQKYIVFDLHESNDDDVANGDATSASISRSSSFEIIPPVDLVKVVEMETHDSDKIGPGSVLLQVKVSPSEEMFLKLESPPEPSKKPSMQWNSALVKGLRMVFESRFQPEVEELS